MQNTKDLIIRDCTESDLDSIQQIENSSFDDPFSPDFFLSLLHDSIFKVAQVHEQVAGYNIYKSREPKIFKRPKKAILISLAVHPSWRRKGVASILLEKMIRDLADCKIDLVELQVMEGNHSAISLYTKFGFVVNGKIANYYGRGKDAIVMERNV
jgi:ribosomal-protein-alanine N-acetyltransferase